jgi:hypothetical protein
MLMPRQLVQRQRWRPPEVRLVVLGHDWQAMPTDDAARLVMRCSTTGWRNGGGPRPCSLATRSS